MRIERETCTLDVLMGNRRRVNEEHIGLIVNMLILRAHTGSPCTFFQIRAYLLEHSFETSAHHTEDQLQHLVELQYIAGSKVAGYQITAYHLAKLVKAGQVTGSEKTGYQPR